MVQLLNNDTKQSRSVRSFDKMAVNALENTWSLEEKSLKKPKARQSQKSKFKAMLTVFLDTKGVIMQN